MLTCNVKFMTIWFRETKYFLSLFLKTLVTLETPLGILLWHIIMAICVFSFIHLSPEASVILGDINKTELKMYCGPLNFGIHSCATEITRESVFSHVDLCERPLQVVSFSVGLKQLLLRLLQLGVWQRLQHNTTYTTYKIIHFIYMYQLIKRCCMRNFNYLLIWEIKIGC